MLYIFLWVLNISGKAEQSFVSALTRFHKRKLESQKRKLKVNSETAARKHKPVTRHPLKETHLGNHIVNNNVNLADLQKQISDLKEIVCTHVLTNKRMNFITVCSLTLPTIVTKTTNTYIAKNKRRKSVETP